MSGNTGVAGGTYGADPVPKKQVTAPDGSTVIGVEETAQRPGSGQTEKAEDRNETPDDDNGRGEN